MKHEDLIQTIEKTCENCYPVNGLAEKLALNRPLIVKLGVDPTRPDIHLGHSIVLDQLRLFQDHGHQVVFLIGDFTAMIGDPSGRDVTRPALTEEEVVNNAASYVAQVSKVLDPQKLVIRYNSEWLSQLSPQAMIKLASLQTVARMLERDDFSKRYQNGQSIAIHEFLYPLLQGYDSVALRADIEIGGTDQTFNLLMGRELQKHYQQPQQVVLTYPLLEGLDGVKKMSKSHDNTISFNDSPEDMYGKIMSISDALMWRYYALLTLKASVDIEALQQQVADGLNPKELKMKLAHEVVQRFYSQADAEAAEQAFVARFQKGLMPEDRPVCQLTDDEQALPLVQLLKRVDVIKSTSEGLRLLKQNAIKVDGEVIQENTPLASFPAIVTVGKRRIVEFKV